MKQNMEEFMETMQSEVIFKAACYHKNVELKMFIYNYMEKDAAMDLQIKLADVLVIKRDI